MCENLSSLISTLEFRNYFQAKGHLIARGGRVILKKNKFVFIFSEKNKIILIFSEKNKMFLILVKKINYSLSGQYLRILNMKKI